MSLCRISYLAFLLLLVARRCYAHIHTHKSPSGARGGLHTDTRRPHTCSAREAAHPPEAIRMAIRSRSPPHSHPVGHLHNKYTRGSKLEQAAVHSCAPSSRQHLASISPASRAPSTLTPFHVPRSEHSRVFTAACPQPSGAPRGGLPHTAKRSQPSVHSQA